MKPRSSDSNHKLEWFAAGVISSFAAIVIAIVATEFRVSAFNNLDSTDAATLIGAFGAVLVGGVISWILQNSAAEHARESAAKQAEQDRVDRQREADEARLETQKAQAISLYNKVQFIASGIVEQKKYIWDAKQIANDAGRLLDPLSRWVQPQITRTFPPPAFDASDLLPLIAAGRVDLINDCQELASRYSVLDASMRIYTEKREALSSLTLPHSRATERGKPVNIEIPLHLASMVVIKENELEDLIQDNYEMVRADVEKAAKLCSELGSTFKKHFGKFIEMKVVQPAD